MTEALLAFLARAYTIYVATNPPAKAKMGTSKGPVMLFSAGLIFGAMTKMKDAPKAAPALVPVRPGSTMGLRKRPCISTPETASIAPVMAQSNTLGKRNCRNTPSWMLAGSLPLKKFPSEEIISPGEMGTAPNAMAHTNTTSSIEVDRIRKDLFRCAISFRMNTVE